MSSFGGGISEKCENHEMRRKSEKSGKNGKIGEKGWRREGGKQS